MSGIWTEKDLPARLRLGPYEGIVTMDRRQATDSGYSWEVSITDSGYSWEVSITDSGYSWEVSITDSGYSWEVSITDSGYSWEVSITDSGLQLGGQYHLLISAELWVPSTTNLPLP